jgi:hypothetical protein
MTSTDIGVAENGTEAIGLSLQLKGTGTKYSDFYVANYDGKYLWSYQQWAIFSTVKIPLVAPSNVVANNITATTANILGCSNWSGIIQKYTMVLL